MSWIAVVGARRADVSRATLVGEASPQLRAAADAPASSASGIRR
jgi:hypothetical protein